MTKMSESRVFRLRWWTLVTIAVSVLVIVLDATVLNVALPTIQRELGATGSELIWMVNAYMMVMGALMLTTGSLGDRFGRAKILQIGVVVFGLASVGAFLARNPSQLIIWRIFMGAGAALILPVTLAIITNVFPENERGKAIGVWAGLNSIGIALGPIIGGLLVENFRWNSIFLINIPIAVIALILGWFLVPDSRDNNPQPLDIPGNVLALAGLSALIYGLINGGSKGWTSGEVLGTLVGSVVLIIVFVLWERRSTKPLLDMSFFKNYHFSAGIAIIVILGLGLNGFQYILTYYMQFVKSYTALGTGLRYLPLALGLLFGAVSSDFGVKKIGTRWVMFIAFIGTAALLLLLSTIKTDSSYWLLGIYLFGEALFIGFIIAPVTNVIMGALPKARAGIGSAINTVFRMVSGAIGVALLGSVLNTVYSSSFNNTIAGTTGLPAEITRAAADSVGAAVMIAGSGQLPDSLSGSLVQAARQSFMDGWQVVAYISGAVFIIGTLIVIKFMPKHDQPIDEE